MVRISWISLAVGVTLGALGATAALLFITVGPQVVPPSGIHDPSAARRAPGDASSASGTAGTKASLPASVTASTRASLEPADAPRLVAWLSEKLQEAYKREGLPEIIGGDAGADAADQVFEYVVEADDTDTVRDLVADVLDRSPADLGLEPGWGVDSRVDCSRPPCIASIDLSRDDGGTLDGCGKARALVEVALREALQPGDLNVEGQQVEGTCGLKVIALSAGAWSRQEEINAGIEGFLENYFSDAKARLDSME